jgi:MFS superfamily sulfate permease-like transporter
MRRLSFLPITFWLGDYSLRRLGPDAVAGLSLAAFVIPESLAYASLAGLPPVSGLYCDALRRQGAEADLGPLLAHRTIDDCIERGK